MVPTLRTVRLAGVGGRVLAAVGLGDPSPELCTRVVRGLYPLLGVIWDQGPVRVELRVSSLSEKLN